MIRTSPDIVPLPYSVMAARQGFGAPFPGITVLLVDPNDQDRKLYADELRSCSTDYMVLEASDGDTGLNLYRTNRIDCIVLELLLPDMSITKVLSEVAPTSGCPKAVVGLTRWDSAILRDIAFGHGAQACLIKSETSGEELDRVIQKVLSSSKPTSSFFNLFLPDSFL